MVNKFLIVMQQNHDIITLINQIIEVRWKHYPKFVRIKLIKNLKILLADVFILNIKEILKNAFN